MHPATRVSAILSLVLLGACASSDQRKPTAAERRGVAAVLAGEWVRPGDPQEYLLFKPDSEHEKTGRFGGFGDYDRYEIKTGLFLGRNFSVELVSATADTEMPTRTVGIALAPDGRSLNLVVPGRAGQPAVRHLYRKVNW